MQDDRYLTTEEAAAYLRLKERKLYELVARGAVPCAKVTGKWLFPRAALDRWIVDNACAGIARLPADGVIYAINVSGMSLSDDQFLAFVIGCIERYGVAPERICFEITETVAIKDIASAQTFMGEMKACGCRFALDDFGAGMSSFAYLKTLPVDFLKIDGQFIRHAEPLYFDSIPLMARNYK